MKQLTINEIKQVSGAGEACLVDYKLDVPLSYFPLVYNYLILIDTDQFDATGLIQAIQDKGLDPNLVVMNVDVLCQES